MALTPERGGLTDCDNRCSGKGPRSAEFQDSKARVTAPFQALALTVARMQSPLKSVAALVASVAVVVVSASVAGAAPAAAGRQAVAIDNFAFGPADVTITVGNAVTWTNLQTARHTATSDTGVWDSDILTQNAAFEFTFNEAGDFAYHCDIHPDMLGVVHVIAEEAPAAVVEPVAAESPAEVVVVAEPPPAAPVAVAPAPAPAIAPTPAPVVVPTVAPTPPAAPKPASSYPTPVPTPSYNYGY
jgi:plastocyanin